MGAGPVAPAAAADSAAFAAVAPASLLAPVPAAHSRCEMFSKRMVCLASGSSAHVQGQDTNCSPPQRISFNSTHDDVGDVASCIYLTFLGRMSIAKSRIARHVTVI